MAFGAILGQASSSVPVGGIILWSGNESNIPTNWNLCDGTNGTPDLRDRFVIGAGNNYEINEIGGSNSIKLTISNLPAHNHSASLNLSGLTTSSAGSHAHSLPYRNVQSLSGGGFGVVNEYGGSTISTNSAGAHTHTISGSGTVSIGNIGSGEAFDNMPPYYALCYIMKIA